MNFTLSLVLLPSKLWTDDVLRYPALRMHSLAGKALSADSGDVNGPFRRDVNKSERSDAGTCDDA
jgi:hypothetical protein